MEPGRRASPGPQQLPHPDPSSGLSPDSPEANASAAVIAFCQIAANNGDEVLHLPVIVDAAESSPTAAAVAAHQIQRFLGKEYATQPRVQGNSIMLIRILSDNPGASFTRNFDPAFVATVKELLGNCQDPGTQRNLRETLDALQATKAGQEGVEELMVMWRKEKASGQVPVQGMQQFAGVGYHGSTAAAHDGRSHRSRRALPSQEELANRTEEARNTARILLQLIQSTPKEEVLENGLLQEFNDRCQGTQRDIQGWINSENPAPDDDTMLTLIETSEQLSLVTTKYQRSVLTARRALGRTSSGEGLMSGGDGNNHAPPGQATRNQNALAAPPAGVHWAQDGAAAPASPSNETFQPPAGPPPNFSNQPASGTPPVGSTPASDDPFADPSNSASADGPRQLPHDQKRRSHQRSGSPALGTNGESSPGIEDPVDRTRSPTLPPGPPAT